jgi:uncharacterized protein YndB with AHSA1/START domain
MEPAHRADPLMLTITRVLPASRQAVFDAWTTVESVQRWMCPDATSIPLAELDVRVGGALRVEMLTDEGERLVHTGVYREVRPPEKLVFTWKSKHTQHRDTLVAVELRALGDKTELRLTQTLLPDEVAMHQHIRGWTQIVEHLAAYLQTRYEGTGDR